MAPLHLLLLSCLLGLALAMNNNFAAADCCARGPSCGREAARRSGPCLPGTWMSAQPGPCRKLACLYCRQGSRRRDVPVCRMAAISKNCFGRASAPAPAGNNRTKPSPKKKNKPKNKPPSGRPGCSYRGSNGKIVIDATRLKLAGAWTRSGSAVVWKAGGGTGIDAMGSGTVCARVIFPMTGKYYMTAVTQAPHGTEHNDLWIRFSGGVDLFRRPGSFRSGNAGWYKGYQNDGGMRMANYLLTIDHNGHQFITKYVAAGRVYTVCFSGRSSKYHLRKIVFVKCAGGGACSRDNNDIRRQMSNLGGSKCY